MRFAAILCLAMYAGVAGAGSAQISWTNATQRVDGTPIPTTGLDSIEDTVIEWGLCVANDVGTVVGTRDVAFPQNTTTVDNLGSGVWCFRGYHITGNGARSDYSNVAQKTIATPVPMPPTNLTVAATTAYTIIKQDDRLVFLPIGTVPADTQCDSTQPVGPYYVVPVSRVSWTSPTGSRPVVVVAQCS